MIKKALFVILASITLLSCRQDKQVTADNSPVYSALSGEIIGTYYRLQYDLAQDITRDLDSLFTTLNSSLSTYVPSATISQLNRAGKTFGIDSSDYHFMAVYEHALRYHSVTNGAFDPTVMPLVNLYGFGYKEIDRASSVNADTIAGILSYVGFDKWSVVGENGSLLISKPAQAQLDFSASAKGYYIDVIAEYLEDLGALNYLVDIGGETVAKGSNNIGQPWTLGVNTPSEKAGLTESQILIRLSDGAVASSGNYRNFRVAADGTKYVHTIDPTTGKSLQSDLLSATVIATDCMTADALATACMVVGLDRAKALIGTIEEVEAYFISDGGDGYQTTYTSGFDQYLLK